MSHRSNARQRRVVVVGVSDTAQGDPRHRAVDVVPISKLDGLSLSGSRSLAVLFAIKEICDVAKSEGARIESIVFSDRMGFGHATAQAGLLPGIAIELPPVISTSEVPQWWHQYVSLQPVSSEAVQEQALARSSLALSDSVLYTDRGSHAWSAEQHRIGVQRDGDEYARLWPAIQAPRDARHSSVGGQGRLGPSSSDGSRESAVAGGPWGDTAAKAGLPQSGSTAKQPEDVTIGNFLGTARHHRHARQFQFQSWRRRIPAGLLHAPSSKQHTGSKPKPGPGAGPGPAVGSKGRVHVFAWGSDTSDGYSQLAQALLRLPQRMAAAWRGKADRLRQHTEHRNSERRQEQPAISRSLDVKIVCILPSHELGAAHDGLLSAARAAHARWPVPRTTGQVAALLQALGKEVSMLSAGTQEHDNRNAHLDSVEISWEVSTSQSNLGGGLPDGSRRAVFRMTESTPGRLPLPELRITFVPSAGDDEYGTLRSATEIVSQAQGQGYLPVLLRLGRGQAGVDGASKLASSSFQGIIQEKGVGTSIDVNAVAVLHQLPSVRPWQPLVVPNGASACALEPDDAFATMDTLAAQYVAVVPFPDALADKLLGIVPRSQSGLATGQRQAKRSWSVASDNGSALPVCEVRPLLSPARSTLTKAVEAATESARSRDCKFSNRNCHSRAACRGVGKDPPLLSVIMAHYERPNLLRQALQALDRQTFRDFEVIVVDDSSQSDEAVQALDNLEESFIEPRGWTLLRLSDGRYLGHSRNAGIQRARGKYLFFVDDDDIGLPNELELLLCALHTGKVDVVSSYVQYFDTPGLPEHLLQPAYGEDLWSMKADYGFIGVGVGPGVQDNVFGPSRFMVSADVVAEAGPYHEEWGVGREDHEYLARLSLMGATVAVLPVPLFAKRGSGGSGAPTMTHTMGRTHALQVALRPYLAGLHQDRSKLELVRSSGGERGSSEIGAGAELPFPGMAQLEPWLHVIQER